MSTIYPYITPILPFLLLIPLLNAEVPSMEASCHKYLDCRRALLQKQWKCSEHARNISQPSCKSTDVLEDFSKAAVGREEFLAKCHAADKYVARVGEYCSYLDIWPEAEDDCSEESFSQHSVACRRLKDCCPEVSRCIRKDYFKVLSKQVTEKRDKTLKILYKCTHDLGKIIYADISSEDTAIARDIIKMNDQLILTVSDIGRMEYKVKSKRLRSTTHAKYIGKVYKPIDDIQNQIKEKLHGTSMLDGSSYIREYEDNADGTALLLKLSPGGSHNMRGRLGTGLRNYRNRNRQDIYQPVPLSSLPISEQQTRPFFIRRPWSSDRQIATSRRFGSKAERKTKKILTVELPVKAKHESPGWLQSSFEETVTEDEIVQPVVASKPPAHIIPNVLQEVSSDTSLPGIAKESLKTIELETTSREPETNYTNEDFDSSLLRSSSSLVSFARNAIPLPMKHTINSGGTGNNDAELEMEAVIDGGTWTMIPRFSTTLGPTPDSPLENFVEQDRISVADVSDIGTSPQNVEAEIKNTIRNRQFHNKVRGTAHMGNHLQTKKTPLELINEAHNLLQKPDMIRPFKRHRRVFGARLVPGYGNSTEKYSLINNLRHPKNQTHCSLLTMCHQLYIIETRACSHETPEVSVPGLPKRRFAKCNAQLQPEYEAVKLSLRLMEEMYGQCLAHGQGSKFTSCTDEPTTLPYLEKLPDCSSRIILLKNHCDKLASCCTSASECRLFVNMSDVYQQSKVRKQELFRKSQKCQLESFHEYSRKKLTN